MFETRAQMNASGGSSVPAAISDIGCEREINEDRYAVIDSAAGRAWIVCDGMGGALGGDLAAQLAIDAIRRELEKVGSSDESSDALRHSIESANRVIVLRRQNPAFANMGTTIVGVIVREDEVSIMHAGDSRAYVINQHKIEQLTTDHTYVQDLVERGTISHEEALAHPQAHVLTRCLGADPRLQLDIKCRWLWEGEGEILLLCSDGLYSLVSDAEIADVVRTTSPQEACIRLVELARERGGYDNITVAVLPLAGELREENPNPERAPRAAVSAPRPRVEIDVPQLPLGVRIVAMVFLFLVGAGGTLVYLLWRLSNL